MLTIHAFCLSWQRIQSKQFSNNVGTMRKNACFSKFIIFCPNQVWHKKIPFWGNRPSCLVYHEPILELVLCKCPFTRYDYSYMIHSSWRMKTTADATIPVHQFMEEIWTVTSLHVFIWVHAPVYSRIVWMGLKKSLTVFESSPVQCTCIERI